MFFSDRGLKRLIIPLIVEQLLAVTIGFIDILMISRVGQNAVSGVSLVDGINILLINIFAALATGGAVVAAQYIGKKEIEQARNSAKQLLVTVLILSLIIMLLCLLFKKDILYFIFGNIEAEVMESAQTYFFYSILSYPCIALFNAGAALFRAMGNANVAMINSLFMNIFNVIFNYILIFIFDLGVAGAAIATLTSRLICAFIMLYMLRDKTQTIHIDSYLRIKIDVTIIKSILKIGIPTGTENGMFQLGKILVQRLVSTFGTAAIAANAVAFNISQIIIIPGMAVGLSMITVIGQCVGAQDYQQVEVYTKKLMKLTYGVVTSMTIVIMLVLDPILGLYALPAKTTQLAMHLVLLHGFFDVLIWPMAFTFPNVLRASNDATFTMMVSVFSMWIFRFGLSFFFANTLQVGVIGVWLAMFVDWFFRAIVFMYRYKSGKWKNRKLV